MIRVPDTVVADRYTAGQQGEQDFYKKQLLQRQQLGNIGQDLNAIADYSQDKYLLEQLAQQPQPQQPQDDYVVQGAAILEEGGLVDDVKMDDFVNTFSGVQDVQGIMSQGVQRIANLEAQGRNANDTRELVQLAQTNPQAAMQAVRTINQLASDPKIRAYMARNPARAKATMQTMGVEGMGIDANKAYADKAVYTEQLIDGKVVGGFAVYNPNTNQAEFMPIGESLKETGRQKTNRAIDEAGGVTKITEKMKTISKSSQDAVEQVSQINANIATIDEAIKALDDGAEVGAIARYLPSFRDSTVRFENAANKMGLNVISSVTFGALSKGELDVAMSTALPKNLDEQGTRDYLLAKRDAQEKLKNFYIDMASRSIREGKTPAEIMIEFANSQKKQPAQTSTQPKQQDPLGLR